MSLMHDIMKFFPCAQQHQAT